MAEDGLATAGAGCSDGLGGAGYDGVMVDRAEGGPGEVARLRKHEGAAGLTDHARRLHRAILAAFAESGNAPSPSDLELIASPAGIDLAVALGELVESDVVAVDLAGELRAAYPFSPVPTAHEVVIAAGATVHAMCAIDALGMSAMLGRPVTINSRDPDTGQAITVTVDEDQATWHPATAVVFAGAARNLGDAPSVDRTCGSINFFESADSAMRWAASHQAITGSVLSQDQAVAAGIAEFGSMMGRARL